MSKPATAEAVQTSIVDNLGDNTLYQAILDIAGNGRELCIATAFFSIDALNLIGEHLHDFERVRLLFGGDANPGNRNKLLHEDRGRRATYPAPKSESKRCESPRGPRPNQLRTP